MAKPSLSDNFIVSAIHKQYCDRQTGRWQQDIAYRDSLRHTHSLSRLKHLYTPDE